MQLDLFEHSRDVMLRHAVIDAAWHCDAVACAAALAGLAAEYPADSLLTDLEMLCRRLRMHPLPDRLSSEAAASSLENLEGSVESAARRVLGVKAQDWLAPRWGELARAMVGLPFDPGTESLHAAPSFLRAGAWQEAVASVATVASWRRQPVPLGWMIEARSHLDGVGAVWAMSAELAWMAPTRARQLLMRLPDPLLGKRLRRFDVEFEESDTAQGFAWFPAWLLIEDGGLAEGLKSAEKTGNTPAELSARLVMTLLTLERQGRHAEIVETRRRLQDVNDALFARYMQSR
ncbi:MAG: hypothetical protein HZB71_05110 [Betaproteobacteria bacterium]|nr:hypothetical protein [Betaproteobacteria bacterium]